jgi:hypothetical protein
MFCASVAYPLDAEAFDFDYFRNRHARCSPNCSARTACGSSASGAREPRRSAAALVAAAYFWVTSPEAFGATLAEHAATLYGDIANFSQTQPVRGWAEVT